MKQMVFFFCMGRGKLGPQEGPEQHLCLCEKPWQVGKEKKKEQGRERNSFHNGTQGMWWWPVVVASGGQCWPLQQGLDLRPLTERESYQHI